MTEQRIKALEKVARLAGDYRVAKRHLRDLVLAGPCPDVEKELAVLMAQEETLDGALDELAAIPLARYEYVNENEQEEDIGEQEPRANGH